MGETSLVPRPITTPSVRVLIPTFVASTGALLAIFGLGILADVGRWILTVIADGLSAYYICGGCGNEVSEFETTSRRDLERKTGTWYCPVCATTIGV